nr:MAG TPA: IrrE protein [Caudoviricetes sp.]
MNTLFKIAKSNDIEIVAGNIPHCVSMSMDGYVCLDFSCFSNSASSRVHLGHEIGHCMTGAFYSRYMPFQVRRKQENTADKWAIRQLIPKSAFFRALDNGYTEVCQLAEYFNVTEEFMCKAYCYYMHGNLAVELYF